MRTDKKHWVTFTATFIGAVLVEGDEDPLAAGLYVKRHLSISADVEAVDVEINEYDIVIDEVHEDGK